MKHSLGQRENALLFPFPAEVRQALTAAYSSSVGGAVSVLPYTPRALAVLRRV